jgi:hypothetical protein
MAMPTDRTNRRAWLASRRLRRDETRQASSPSRNESNGAAGLVRVHHWHFVAPSVSVKRLDPSERLGLDLSSPHWDPRDPRWSLSTCCQFKQAIEDGEGDTWGPDGWPDPRGQSLRPQLVWRE